MFQPTSTKPQALFYDEMCMVATAFLGVHCTIEWDHIPSLKSHGETLKEEGCLSRDFNVNADASVYLLSELLGQTVPRDLSLHCIWVEDVEHSVAYLSNLFCAALWAAVNALLFVYDST